MRGSIASDKLGFTMPQAATEASEPTSAADIARRSRKQSVEDHEPQLVLGIVAHTSDLRDRVHDALLAKGWDWAALADALMLTRQAVLSSISRRHVQYTRVKQIAVLLDVTTKSLLVKQYDCAANEKSK